jgi:dimethylpropiothetin dethiomethylase
MIADSDLREVLDTAASAFRGCRTPLAGALAAALERPFEGRSASSAKDIPVCRFLGEVMGPSGGDLDGLLAALGRIRAGLPWRELPAAIAPEQFRHRHGWAEIAGPDGTVVCDGFRFGLYLQAPETFYPAHCHEAEELYLVLSGTAEWQAGDEEFSSKPPGSLIHHRPWQAHAMRTLSEPLLALWGWLGAIGNETYRMV